MKRCRSVVAVVLGIGLAVPLPAQMFPPPPPPAGAQAAPASAPAPGAQSFAQQELDQLLAPIALYPDALLAQVLMASTYPIEVVQAERWVKANAGLRDEALKDALQQQPWDASVKSLAVFPQVLTMMSEKLDWTQKLGDAFLAQTQDVMATVQTLRAKAVETGALKDSKELKVGSDASGGTSYITVESASPEVVYVPTYDPMVVYGTWWYPAYPPYYWYPPGYVYGPGLGFAAGIIVGGALWGGVNWGRGDVYVDHRTYNNFNRTNVSGDTWRHNAEHRGAVPYRDPKVAQQYGRGQAADAASRDAFRGRADAGRESVSRDLGGARGGSAFDTRNSAQTRDYSNRGSSSISSARSSGNMGGGARAGGYGGGGARGGGGRGGGRR